MKFLLTTAMLAALAINLCKAEEGWSWSGDKKEDAKIEAEPVTEVAKKVAARSADPAELEDVVDSILNSGREGRNLKGYDELYSDPSVQEVLQKGDDSDARNLIKDRLCTLGLMQCEDIEGKRPSYISPEDLVYAQPVDIKPIGRPIPSIPVKNPARAHYGPPKPMPFPPKNPNIPPRRYGSNHPPSKPFYGPGPIKPYYESHELSRPPFVEPDVPYGFESSSSSSSSGFYQNKDIKIKVPVTSKPAVQEHVHHHFHHNSDADGSLKIPTVIVNNPGFKPSQEISSTIKDSASFIDGFKGFNPNEGTAFVSSSTVGSSSFNNYKGGYGGQSLANYSPVKPVVEEIVGPQQFAPTPPSSLYGGSSQSLYTNTNNFGGSYGGGSANNFGGSSLGSYGSGSSSNFGASSLGSYATTGSNFGASSSFGAGNSFGASVGSYGSSGFYKKESNVNGNLQGNHLNSYDKFVGAETGRAENYDCVCVPYDQCPSQDVIGRKDDLYLALDPRNLKTDIEAEEEKVVVTDGSGNMTVVKVAKGAAINSTEVQEVTKRTKREAPVEEKKAEKAKKVEARQISHNKQIKPTFGVSFGLPSQGGYPLNPYDPQQTPLTGSNAGINLGLVSVNPLVAVQLTKDDDGEKVVKPFVNLHVTPNDFLVNKVSDFFSYKKHELFNKHQHYHQHTYRPSYPHYHGGHDYHESPIIYDRPHFSKPYYHEKPYFESQPSYFEAKPSYFEPKPSYYEPQSGYYDDSFGFGGGYDEGFYGRAAPNYTNGVDLQQQHHQLKGYATSLQKYNNYYNSHDSYGNPLTKRTGKSARTSNPVKFPTNRRRRDVTETVLLQKRQAFYGNSLGGNCGPRHVCCKRPVRPQIPGLQQCGTRHSQGINGRIKNPVYVDGDSEFGEYPWQVAILKKDPKESVYICGGTLIDHQHIITAAHCVKTYTPYDLRVRLGEWDVNHDVEFFPYIERDVSNLHVHPEFYAGTLYNDLAVIRMDKPVDFAKYPHISPACLPNPHDDYSGTRCWTTGWGKDAFGDFGKYQNILKEVDVPVVGHGECQQRMKHTRLGYDFKLHPGFVCAGGEEGKDACKGDGGGPMVCERGGTWQVVGVVSWGIGCGQSGVPGVYVKVAHYLDWIRQITQRF